MSPADPPRPGAPAASPAAAASPGVPLRDPAHGAAELPWVVGLLAADGRCLPVPAARRRPLPDGGLQLDGAAHGFTARLRLAAPRGTTRRAELTVRRDGAASAEGGVPLAGTEASADAPASVDVGLRVELRLGPTDDPGWLVPGAFYGQNRLPDCARPYPRYQAGAHDPEGMVADAWSLRADRCATPAVFARDRVGGAALACAERGPLGAQGVGLALTEGGRPALRLHAPYREEPVRYYGSATPLPPETPLHRWAPGEERTLTFTVHLLDADPHAYAPVLRELAEAGQAPAGAAEVPAAWVGLAEAAELTAHGLHRWHYRAEPPVLLETAAFDREALGAAGDRPAMHVSWISGTPYAHALLAHARRVGDAGKAEAAVRVLDHIAQHRTPAGTFWGQWTEGGGWGAGWTGDPRRLHSRTLGDATLFLLRALRAERALGHDHPGWEEAVRANLAVAAAGADPATGRLAAAHHTETGAALSHRGSAGLAWVAPLVEAADAFDEPGLLAVARRAGAAYAADVRGEFLCGAPEDVSLAPTSEDGYNAVIAYTLLHEAERGETGDQRDGRWLGLARRAADWTLTFRYSYDVHFDPHTLLARYGFRTRGLDQASPSNQHLHAFGLVCLPEWVRLARHLKDPALLRSARQNLDACRQFVARADGDFNAYRGMVTERFYQTDCFQAKGMVLTLSHAWTVGMLLYACEVALRLPEFAELAEFATSAMTPGPGV